MTLPLDISYAGQQQFIISIIPEGNTMDLSKNDQPNSDNAGPDYLPPQEGFTSPSEPTPQGHEAYPVSSPNPPYNQQGYAGEQFPGQPLNNPYGYQQVPQNYPIPPAPPSYGNYPQPPYNGYGQPNYYAPPNVYPQPYGYPPVSFEGQKLAKESWILGLVGLFILGIVLGGIGLYKAFKAQALGSNATAGFVLSSLAIAGHIFWIFVFLLGMSDSPSSY
jgi:hypothetical protein